MEYGFVSEVVTDGRVVRFWPTDGDGRLSYARVIELWRDTADFRACFTTTLADAPFEAFRWETPAFSENLADRDFEFVLVDAPGFRNRRSDGGPFEGHFTSGDVDQGVVTFENLRGDATLVVPSPRMDDSAYGDSPPSSDGLPGSRSMRSGRSSGERWSGGGRPTRSG